jgi:uncharacterized Fe-S cluster-containing radical SAM superfamily protein
MFDPEKRAEILRPKMVKNGKFLIARIRGSGEEFKQEEEKIVYKDYFKFKWYLKPEFSSAKEIWSPKLVGLSENLWSVPLKQIKKIRFQNPPYSAAYRLNNEPKNYNKALTVQAAGCNYDCNFCYVPRELNSANLKYGKYFSAKEIIEIFLKARKVSDEPLNVIRLTGGEIIIVPELIIDIYRELENKDLNEVYIWIDTNLSITKYLEKIENDLRPILKKRNVGVIGCFKGVSKEDFSIITGAEQRFYENQFKTAKLFLDWKTDFYAYLPALVYANSVKEKIKSFIEKLRLLNKNLPLRIEVDMIIEYSSAVINIAGKTKQGRSMPKTDQRMVFDLWYNKLLPIYYSKKMLNKFSCKVPL